MKKIAKYEIIEQLGQGGMGIVYKAFDPLMEREVAIKVLAEQLFDQPENTPGIFFYGNINDSREVGSNRK